MEELVASTLTDCAAPATRRVYGAQLARFLSASVPLSREDVALHLQQLRHAGLGDSTVAVTIAAIRKLARHALTAGLITAEDHAEIRSVRAGPVRTKRPGRCPTLHQVMRLLWLPDRDTYWGRRDACILSVMIGCGLTRAEMATLRWESYQSRDGRMCLNVVGKGGRLRAVPVPTWAQADMDVWYLASREHLPKPAHNLQHLERTRPRDPQFVAGGMSGDAVHDLVRRYAKEGGYHFRPGDLRRGLAKMLFDAAAPLEQIRSTLGHSSVAATRTFLMSSPAFQGLPPMTIADMERRHAAAHEEPSLPGAARGKGRVAEPDGVRRRRRPLSGSVREYILAGGLDSKAVRGVGR
jgi:integrase/recombinase XerD